jgi:hypothetical protein
MGCLTKGFMVQLDGRVMLAAVNADKVERSSVRGNLKHREAKLGLKMELVEGGVLIGALYRVGAASQAVGGIYAGAGEWSLKLWFWL